MKKEYLELSFNIIKLTADVITTSEAKPKDFGDGDWGVKDDFI